MLDKNLHGSEIWAFTDYLIKLTRGLAESRSRVDSMHYHSFRWLWCMTLAKMQKRRCISSKMIIYSQLLVKIQLSKVFHKKQFAMKGESGGSELPAVLLFWSDTVTALAPTAAYRALCQSSFNQQQLVTPAKWQAFANNTSSSSHSTSSCLLTFASFISHCRL